MPTLEIFPTTSNGKPSSLLFKERKGVVMISKELLSEILNNGVTHVMIDLDINNDVEIWFNDDTLRSINIYELAHRCKEWALEIHMWIMSYSHSMGGNAKVFRGHLSGRIEIDFHADTEPEAIFKACQYILENR